jgi:hypothetical protein
MDPIGAVTRNAGPKRPKPPKTVQFARGVSGVSPDTGGDTPPIRVTQRPAKEEATLLQDPNWDLSEDGRVSQHAQALHVTRSDRFEQPLHVTRSDLTVQSQPV